MQLCFSSASCPLWKTTNGLSTRNVSGTVRCSNGAKVKGPGACSQGTYCLEEAHKQLQSYVMAAVMERWCTRCQGSIKREKSKLSTAVLKKRCLGWCLLMFRNETLWQQVLAGAYWERHDASLNRAGRRSLWSKRWGWRSGVSSNQQWLVLLTRAVTFKSRYNYWHISWHSALLPKGFEVVHLKENNNNNNTNNNTITTQTIRTGLNTKEMYLAQVKKPRD